MNTTNTKLGLRPSDAAELIGSETLFEEMRKAGWIKPTVERHKLTLYDYGAVVKCWVRVLGGELPPRLPNGHGAVDAERGV